MSTFPKLPSCPWWCVSDHATPDSRHARNLDLIEFLDSRECLIEVNVFSLDDAKTVQVLFTDLDAGEHQADLDADTAWMLGRIIELFDRRGLRELGVLLMEGATLLDTEEGQR